MAGHVQLKFVMTECSKTQICLTRHNCSSLMRSYPNDPKFLDRQVRTNRADPDQTAPERYTQFSMLSASFWTYYPMVKPHCSQFRIITAIFPGVQTFKIIMVLGMWRKTKVTKKYSMHHSAVIVWVSSSENVSS